MKRALLLTLVAGLVAAFSVPAAGQETEPTTVPEVVNIEDPAGDGNYLNGQGVEDDGDHVTPADASTVADILKVWFSHDADVIRAHVQTELPHSPNTASAYFYRVMADASGDTNCLWFQIATTGPTSPNVAELTGSLRDLCGENNETLTEGITAQIEELPDGTGLSTVIVPRSLHPALADDLVLGAPTAHSRNYVAGAATAPQVDDTRPGTDYTITPPEIEEDEEPKKKGCSKGSPKAKKKGCKKR